MRTQIHLTETEIAVLDSLAEQLGKNRNDLIHEAIDNLLSKYNPNERNKILERAAGMWKNRDDLPDFPKIRKSMDRQ